jgi:ZIP family zinc transporter
MLESNVFWALIISLFAGLSTGLGGIISFFVNRNNSYFLSLSLGFSAGVMVYVSFMELLTESISILGMTWGTRGELVAILVLFFGMMFTALIDMILPEAHHPSDVLGELDDMTEEHKKQIKEKHLIRVATLTGIAVVIHNLPEGVATLTTAYSDLSLGLAVGIAIALHNIPEGIAIAVPFYHGTGKKWRAVGYAFLSGLAEPVGAVLAYFVLAPFLTSAMVAIILAFVAGIMIFISFDELIPTAQSFDIKDVAVYGVLGGMFLMAITMVVV